MIRAVVMTKALMKIGCSHILKVMVLLSLSSSAWANMVIDRSIIYFDDKSPNRQDVEVSNPDKDILYVKVEVLEVINPGTDSEQRVLVKNPKESQFIVTPNKLVVKPGKKKTVRLLNLNKTPQKDRIFRINLKPVTPPLAPTETGVKVVVGYQLLAIVQPPQAKPELSAKRDGQTITFTNSGRTNVLLRAGRQCPPNVALATAAENQCAALPTRRMYSGNTWTLDLPYNTPVEYFLSVGLNNEKAVY